MILRTFQMKRFFIAHLSELEGRGRRTQVAAASAFMTEYLNAEKVQIERVPEAMATYNVTVVWNRTALTPEEESKYLDIYQASQIEARA